MNPDPRAASLTLPFLPTDVAVACCSLTVCLDLLREKWTDSFTVPKALEAIRLLLAHPNPDDALRQWIAELTIAHKQSNGTDRRYVDAATAATHKDASRSVAAWRGIWGC